jgi:hypothetical protein
VLASRRPGALTAWGSACLRGEASPDQTGDAVRGGDAMHRVVGLPGDDRPTTVAVAVARLRALGASSLRLVLPEPGDLTGLPGPPSLSAPALAAGSAVLTVGPIEAAHLALIPAVSPSGAGEIVTWDVAPVSRSVPPSGLPTLGEAERQLAEVMRDATETLDLLDVARGRDEITARLAELDRGLRGLDLPSSLPARAQRLIVSGTRLMTIVAIADESDGSAVTAAVATARAETLRPVRTAARYALCAGYSALSDPAVAR